MNDEHRSARGLARFATDLPDAGRFVSLGEGDTPVLLLDALARRLKLSRLSAKMESMNPTGSYKDRVAAMSVSLAIAQGKAGWIATSSGNAGVAMAAYGARAGLPGFLCMIAEAPLEKRLPLMPYPSQVLGLRGIGQGTTGKAATALFEQVTAAAIRHNLYVGVTANAFNLDGMRGIDTIGYELAEQIPSLTHVYVPTGGGGLLACIARGLEHREMAPRIIACQPAGCAPIVQFLEGEILTPEIEHCESGISALQLPRPPDGKLAAEAVTRSGGWGSAVSDESILTAQRLLAATEGIFVEPASAAALSALIHDLERGRIERDSHPVLMLTGAGWKDLGRFTADVERMKIADLGTVAAQVDAWARGLSLVGRGLQSR